MSELLPCPFGCEADRYRHEADEDIIGAVAIGCDKCGALGPFMDLFDFDDDKEQAFAAAEEAWNTRAMKAAEPLPQGDESRMRMFLEILSAIGGEEQTDGYRHWTAAFCDEHEGRDPDTYNQAIQAGYVDWSHNSDTDCSTIRLTDEGRAALVRSPIGDDGRERVARAMRGAMTPINCKDADGSCIVAFIDIEAGADAAITAIGSQSIEGERG